VDAAGATRPANAATTATACAGDGLRRAALPLAERRKERDCPRRIHTLAMLTLNRVVGLAHRPQSFEFRMAIGTRILVHRHLSHQPSDTLFNTHSLMTYCTQGYESRQEEKVDTSCANLDFWLV
jgi:hypothetical protein